MAEPKRDSKAGFGEPFAPPFQPAFPQKMPTPPAQKAEPGVGPKKGPAGIPPGPQAPALKPPIPGIPSAGPSEETIDFVTEAIVAARAPNIIPLLMRRCITDVWVKPSLLGTTKRERFRGAVAISLSSLMRSGRLLVDTKGVVQLTPRGRQEDAKRSTATPDRTLKEAMYRRIITEVKLERPATR